MAAAKAYLADASHPVHVKGSGTSGGQAISIDMQYVGSDSSGSYGIMGGTAQLISAGGSVYLKFDNALWSSAAPTQAAQIEALVGSKWIKADPKNSEFAEFTSLASRSFITDQILASSSTLSLGAPTTVDGVACQALVGANGTLYVASDNSRPIRLLGTGQAVSLDFTYASAPAPAAPAAANVLDLSALGGG
jgi:hypothetical protein